MTTTRSIGGRTVCVTGASSGTASTSARSVPTFFLAGRSEAPTRESAATITAARGRADVAQSAAGIRPVPAAYAGRLPRRAR